MNDRDVKTAPLVDADAEADGLGSHGQHRRVVADKDDATGGRDGGFDDSNNVRDGEAAKQRPHGEVLETSRRRRELVAEGVILHVNADKVVESRGREAQDSRDFLSVEQISSFVPVDPHAAEVVAEQVVQRVSREERQAVGDPVLLIRIVVEVGLRPLPQLANRLSPLLIGSRPDAQADTVQGMRRVLLEDKSVVDAMRLAPASANLDVVRKAGLQLI